MENKNRRNIKCLNYRFIELFPFFYRLFNSIPCFVLSFTPPYRLKGLDNFDLNNYSIIILSLSMK